MITVALADDDQLVRMGLEALIGREDDLRLVGEASDGDGTLELVRRTAPDIRLLDIRCSARTESPFCAPWQSVVVVTTFEIDQYVVDALQAGAGGFLLKDSVPDELVRAIRVVISGQALLSPSITARGRPVRPAPRGHDSPSAVVGIAHRPRTRDRRLGDHGHRANDEIAAELYLSPDTVRAHVSRAITKLDARSRAQLVVYAVRAGSPSPTNPDSGGDRGRTRLRTEAGTDSRSGGIERYEHRLLMALADAR